MLAVNTDAHSVEGLEQMVYGVTVARRAWLGKDHVLNSLPWTNCCAPERSVAARSASLRRQGAFVSVLMIFIDGVGLGQADPHETRWRHVPCPTSVADRAGVPLVRPALNRKEGVYDGGRGSPAQGRGRCLGVPGPAPKRHGPDDDAFGRQRGARAGPAFVRFAHEDLGGDPAATQPL